MNIIPGEFYEVVGGMNRPVLPCHRPKDIPAIPVPALTVWVYEVEIGT